jgi:hypothetical protein
LGNTSKPHITPWLFRSVVIVISGMPVRGGVISGGDVGSASFEQEKRNTRNANSNCINRVFT